RTIQRRVSDAMINEPTPPDSVRAGYPAESGASTTDAPATEKSPRPVPTAATPSAPPSGLFILDRFLALLLLGLTFLVASFAATNSEVWMHLASGRVIAEGRWQYGVDPFSSAPESTPWYNPNWLYCLLLYKGYQWFGGAGLVIAKAFATVLLGCCLLCIRPSSSNRFTAFLITPLAALSLTPPLP